jgi:hypothetical protein
MVVTVEFTRMGHLRLGMKVCIDKIYAEDYYYRPMVGREGTIKQFTLKQAVVEVGVLIHDGNDDLGIWIIRSEDCLPIDIVESNKDAIRFLRI